MKNRHRTRDFLAGAVTMALAMNLVLPAGAALAGKTIQVLTGVEIFVDGVKMEPTDAQGNPVETFAYNGTTYVPLRAVSQSLGKNVNWDGANQRVYIGEAPGTKQYLIDICPPYENVGYTTPPTFDMAGKKYANGIKWNSGVPYAFALFNLNGQYTSLEFDIGHVDGGYKNDSVLYIYLDGEISYSMDLSWEMLPQHISIPLHNALQMRIEVGESGNAYGLANVEIY